MKRFALAALAVCAAWAMPASAAPIHIYGQGVLTDYLTTTYGRPDMDTPIYSPVTFDVYYDTTGTLPNGAPFYGQQSVLNLSSAVLPTFEAGTRGAFPTIISTPTSFVLSDYYGTTNTTFTISLNVASPVISTQGPIAFLPGSTLRLGTASAAASQTYAGYITSISTASAVPEISTWAMMLVGVGAIGAVLRRGQARRQAAPIAAR